MNATLDQLPLKLAPSQDLDMLDEITCERLTVCLTRGAAAGKMTSGRVTLGSRNGICTPWFAREPSRKK